MERILKTFMLTAAFTSLALTLTAQETVEVGSDAFNDAVRQYLLENPEVIFEAVDVYNARQEQAALEQSQKALSENRDAIYDDQDAVIVGKVDAENSIVEFVDYNCGYCRKSHNELADVIAANPDTRILVRQLPILSQGSLEGSKTVLAVQKLYGNDAALALHNRLYDEAEKVDAEVALSFAEEAGHDRAKIEEEMEGEAVHNALTASHDLSQKLQIDGTPGFVIGDEVVRGYVPVSQMNQIIQNSKS